MPINLYLACTDLEATRAFYENVLRFTVTDSAMNTLSARHEDCSLIFFEGNASEPALSGTVYCFVSDVDAYHASVAGHVALEWPLQNMSYGTREFALKDVNGYRLAFAQSSASAD